MADQAGHDAELEMAEREMADRVGHDAELGFWVQLRGYSRNWRAPEDLRARKSASWAKPGQGP